jgi:hypothetical protein
VVYNESFSIFELPVRSPPRSPNSWNRFHLLQKMLNMPYMNLWTMLSLFFGVYREFHHTSSLHPLTFSRETSNKALNAINQISLVPFLMSFLASREHIPLFVVIAAGIFFSPFFDYRMSLTVEIAQCLYVLTDDNQPAIEDVRSSAAYVSCLLSILHIQDGVTNDEWKKSCDERMITFRVLVSGMFIDSKHLSVN